MNINQNQILAKCSKGNQAITVCFSQHCGNKAFLCDDQQCQCQTLHKVCLKLSVQNLQQAILVNSYSLKPLQEQIQTVFNKAIDQLSIQRDRVLIQIDEKFQYLGLTKNERKFIQVVKKGANDSQFNCNFVWKLQNQLKGEAKLKESLDELQKEIKNIGEEFDKELVKFSNRFTKLLQQVKQREEEIFLKSKIIKTVEDQAKLLAFFTGKQVESAQMLYRASQDEFLLSKFHQKCDNIPHTLTLVETQFGKVVGGFTSFCWYKPKTGHYVSAQNNQNDHFLFSLTHNDKFMITQNVQHAIYCHNNDQNYGPTFGSGHDLYICNKANQANSSSGGRCSTYTNTKYKTNDNESITKIMGGANFKVKEWEVWKIEFKK